MTAREHKGVLIEAGAKLAWLFYDTIKLRVSIGGGSRLEPEFLDRIAEAIVERCEYRWMMEHAANTERAEACHGG